MPVVSSVLFGDNHTQRDGTRWVGDAHTDHRGRVFRYEYLASPRMMNERAAVMAARVVALNAQLEEEERQDEERASRSSADGKMAAYVDGLTDAELKAAAGLTDRELEVLRATRTEARRG